MTSCNFGFPFDTRAKRHPYDPTMPTTNAFLNHNGRRNHAEAEIPVYHCLFLLFAAAENVKKQKYLVKIQYDRSSPYQSILFSLNQK